MQKKNILIILTDIAIALSQKIIWVISAFHFHEKKYKQY